MTNKFRSTSKGRVAPNGYLLCDPLPKNEVLVSTCNNIQTDWVIGKAIGMGGFGEVYLCRKKDDASKTEFAIKVDRVNGPLRIEVFFTSLACRSEQINAFKEERNLTFLGIPTFIANGKHIRNNCEYRFLVMDRFGEELQVALTRNRLCIPLICRIASRIIDALEFIHSYGYIHADIKSTNILRAKTSSSLKRYKEEDDVTEDDEYYLIDYGLVQSFMCNGKQLPYKEDSRKANTGTREFRSRDAHVGVISPRSDIESLGYNLIVWFYGYHPWAEMGQDVQKIYLTKQWAMNNINEFLEKAFSPKRNFPIISSPPRGLDNFFKEVAALEYETKPDYVKFKSILTDIARLNTKEPMKQEKKCKIIDNNLFTIRKPNKKETKLNEMTVAAQNNDSKVVTKVIQCQRKAQNSTPVTRKKLSRPAKSVAIQRIETFYKKR